MDITHFDKAKAELALAGDIDTIKDMRDKAEAIRAYMKQAKESLEIQNRAAEIKIRAERRGGEILGGMVKAGNPQLSHDGTIKVSDIGITRNTSSRWQKMATLPEEKFEAYISESNDLESEITTAGVLRLVKRMDRDEPDQKFSETLAVSDLEDLAGQKFGTVYADPPWSYSNQSTRAATDNHYETMSVEEIADLPVSDFIADDAHLHLWTTNAFLFDSKKIMEAWGFEYKSCFVWVKPQMGIGNYWRVSHEFLLLGVRGNQKRFLQRDKKSWLEIGRKKHSAKPDEIANIIEMVSPGPFIELFGRKTRDNWVVWGNEIKRDLFNGGAFNESV